MREEFLIQRQGKSYVLFAGLLDEAHRVFAKAFEMETELAQVPDEANGEIAIVTASFFGEDSDGRTVKTQGIGDASASYRGAGPAEKSAPIRMAETRAKARALRDAVNVGATSLEEMPGEAGDDGGAGGNVRQHPTAARDQGPQGRGGQGRGQAARKARKQQVDLLKTLAVEWAGEGGVERLEGRIGKPLGDLTTAEADEWIERLTPEGRE